MHLYALLHFEGIKNIKVLYISFRIYIQAGIISVRSCGVSFVRCREYTSFWRYISTCRRFYNYPTSLCTAVFVLLEIMSTETGGGRHVGPRVSFDPYFNILTFKLSHPAYHYYLGVAADCA